MLIFELEAAAAPAQLQDIVRQRALRLRQRNRPVTQEYRLVALAANKRFGLSDKNPELPPTAGRRFQRRHRLDLDPFRPVRRSQSFESTEFRRVELTHAVYANGLRKVNFHLVCSLRRPPGPLRARYRW